MNVRKRRTAIAVGAVVVSLVAGPGGARAQSPEFMQDFETCAATADRTERLGCYDALASNARERIARDNVENFGRSDYELRQESEDMPREGAFAEVDELNATIVESATNGIGKRLIILDNGQVWRETNPSTLRGSLRQGMAVTISEGLGGAYRIKAEGKRGFLTVQRIR